MRGFEYGGFQETGGGRVVNQVVEAQQLFGRACAQGMVRDVILSQLLGQGTGCGCLIHRGLA